MIGSLLDFFREVFFFAAYVSGGNSFPEPLSAKDEREYLEKYAAGHDDAREKLIEHNLRLVAHIAKKYTTNGRSSDDLISIGTIGLIKAVSSYNIAKKTALATYAARCIENEILMSIRTEKRQAAEVFLFDTVGTDRDGNEIPLCELLGSDASAVLDAVELKFTAETLTRLMNRHLTRRERLVIELRYGLCGSYCRTQREIANMLDISRSYVSRIEKKALQKLNNAFAKLNKSS
jgi:RNA polymerase sporulation-specific sigma factor